MNDTTASFLATIAYGLLALAGLLLANLVGYSITGSPIHAAGVLSACAAAFASYISQGQFTIAADWRDAGKAWSAPGYSGPSCDWQERADSFMAVGRAWKWTATITGILSGLAFMWGV